MGDAIGQILASAIGIAISPIPLIAMVLMLATPRGRTNGTVFTLAWAVALGVVVTIVLASTSGGSALAGGGTPAIWTSWVKLGFGILFFALAASQWRRRPAGGEGEGTPVWMKVVDTFTPVKAAGLASAPAVANPKNLVLTVGGALAVASSGASLGERSVRVLGGWKTWMSAHNAAIVLTGLVILGAKYVGDAIITLTNWTGALTPACRLPPADGNRQPASPARHRGGFCR